jgi:hypothetical protein
MGDVLLSDMYAPCVSPPVIVSHRIALLTISFPPRIPHDPSLSQCDVLRVELLRRQQLDARNVWTRCLLTSPASALGRMRIRPTCAATSSWFLHYYTAYDRPPSLHSPTGVLPLLQATRAIAAYTQRPYYGHRAPNPSRAPSLAAASLRALLLSCARSRSAVYICVARTLRSPEPSLVGHK